MEIVIRATVIYWFLWLVVRGTGKRSLAELTPLEMILTVVIGDFVQQAVTQEDMSITGAGLAVGVFVAWTLTLDAFARRSPRFARVIDGEPVVVLRNGAPLHERLRAERLTLADLTQAARIQGFGDLANIDYGILEADGKFSFIPKQ